MDGRRNRGNKDAFSNLSGVVWTGWPDSLIFIAFKRTFNRTLS